MPYSAPASESPEEARYQALFTRIGLAVFQSTLAGQVIAVNPAFARLFGYASPADVAALVQDVSADLFAEPGRRPELIRPQAEAPGRTVFENWYRRQDGSTFLGRLTIEQVVDAAGQAFFEGFIEDVTDRHAADEALRQKTEELENFFTCTRDLLCIADTEGYFRRLNQEWENTLGYRLDELEGQRFLNFVHPDDQAATLTALTDLAAQKAVLSLTNRYRRKDGTYRWLEWRATPVGKRIYAAARDITARAQIEDQLSRALERLNLATRAASLGIWDWNIPKDKLLWDDQMYALYGILPTDFGGAYAAWLNGLHPADRARSDEESHLALSGAKDYDTEFRVVWPDGTVRTLKAYAQVIADEAGRPVRMTGVNFDITESKQAEARLATALAEKEALLRELYHRTKNNMQVIIALLGLQAAALGDPRLQAALQETQNRIHSMALVHQMLYQSQNLAHIDLSEYLRALTELLQTSYAVAPKRVALTLAVEKVEVAIDVAVPCGLILNELISNALKHAFPGDRQGEIQVWLHRAPPGELVLGVADNGVGLPPGFEWEHSDSLGLRTVLTLVRQLNGQVTFGGPPGTRCQIRLNHETALA